MLPSTDLNEFIHVRALAYVGSNPDEADSFQFSGPYGITLHLKLVMPRPDKIHSGTKDATLFLPGLAPLWSQNSPRIGFKLACKQLVRVSLSETDLEALPTAPAARAAALIEHIAIFLDPETPRFKNGSENEMRALLQAFSSLTHVPLEVMSAVTDSDKPALKSHGKNGWVSCGYLTPTLIVEWFSPIASLPNFFADARADIRKPHRLVLIWPHALTGHDRFEAVSAIAAFLKARRQDWHVDDEIVREALAELKLDDQTIATLLEAA